ncbi:FAD binding domain protein [Corynespora cassiicola Philippines]|uniref:FAD binding domain protein n=1 Tax=Corynespora cassiicola Philippines TaxID=1448308 RepID=A0A2T2P1B5_CORCC|nr:FAD binding domain protein [Corynespora cassiicola Philippines]
MGRLSFLALLSLPTAIFAASNSTCKCVPSDPCWPTATTWTSLNETLDGHLLPTSLPKSVCPDGGSGSETYIVNATDATHIQTTLRFAKEHNLKVNVNNTGHAGFGRSSTCGALFIHTHYMKGLEFHDQYVPKSCSTNMSHMAASLGAGEQDDDVFQALAKYNAATVGGTFDTVGIVGWATSGGHGWLTSSYGMGADNIFEVEIVTPTGEILVANECQNTELFWATRGGGGGTYGVITRITMKAYPMPQTTQLLWYVTSSNTTARQWWEFVAELHVDMVEMNERGFQGYYTITRGQDGTMSIGGYFMAYDKSESEVDGILQPLFARVGNSTLKLTSNVTRHDGWIDAYNLLPKQTRDSNSGPGGVLSTTRLLTRRGLTEDVEASMKMFEAIGPNVADGETDGSSVFLAGSLIASQTPVDNALNPAWRDTAVHLIAKLSWDTELPEDRVLEFRERMTNGTGYAMRKISPDSGCYANEIDQLEPNWQWAMYGPHYDRLRSIKAKYDPDNILWCRRCVGSDEWAYNEDDGSLCPRSLAATWPNFAY